MQARAAEWPGFARPFCCFSEVKFLKHAVLNPSFEKVLKPARRRLFKELLTRNLHAASFLLVLVVVLVLEIHDISPLNQRNKIVAGKSGSFRGAEAH